MTTVRCLTLKLTARRILASAVVGIIILGMVLGTVSIENLTNRVTGNPSSGNLSDSSQMSDKNWVSFEAEIAGEARELVPGIIFHWCPKGQFVMGTPGVTHHEASVSVTLSSGFWIGETEVTQGQWTNLMKTSPWKGNKFVQIGDAYAASYISYSDAKAFVEKLTDQERAAGRLPVRWKYAVPTEAQWEYACRATSKSNFSFGDSPEALDQFCWFDENAAKKKEEYAHPVGLKKPNKWGLRDMHGNVWEWCADWYQSKLPGGTDPAGLPKGTHRICRGGSGDNPSVHCRSALRNKGNPGDQGDGLGFRLAAVRSGK